MRFWKKKEPEAYIARKEYSKAIEAYRERLAQQPENTDLQLKVADTYLLANQTEEAIREYRALAELYTKQDSLLKAIAMYKKILNLDPKQRDIEQRLIELNLRTRESENKLFRDLSPEEFQQLVENLALKHFHENTVIVKEGDPGSSLFIVIRGEVRVLTKDAREKEVMLAQLGEGEFFGEVALLTGKPRTATIITNTDSELLELTREDYQKIVSQYPNVKKVMEDFHLQRALKTVEAMIQSFHNKN